MSDDMKDGDPVPPVPVSTSICSDFDAELGAEVTFTNFQAGAQIQQVGTWPFCGPNGGAYGPPIGPFPLPGTGRVYIKSSGLSVGTTYSYNVTPSCPQGVTKGVKIIASARLKKSA